MALPSLMPVVSSMIRAVGYDAGSEQLYVQFNTGATWEYDDVPLEAYETLMGGGSVGSLFNATIKNSYDGREV